jgi:pimeloyl-ACP methyl ester carboxylesterase
VKVLALLLVLLAAAMLLLWVFQRRLIYLPSSDPVPSADSSIEGARDVKLLTGDGLELGAWFVPPQDPDREIAVLVANGNAGDRSSRAPLAQGLSDEGFSVLLFDYRGYGGNPGTPSEEGLALDVRAAHEFLTEDEGIPTDRLVYFGESLGAAVVTELAKEFPPGGLVLRSPFTDLASVGQVHYPFIPVRALLKDRYPVQDHIRDLDVPTTVVYGSNDTVVPPEQSRAVADAASGPTSVVEISGAGHNDIALVASPRLIAAVVELSNQIETSP